MPVISLNQALEEGKILETGMYSLTCYGPSWSTFYFLPDLRYYCSKSKDLSQSNLALPILLALTRAPGELFNQIYWT